MSELMEIEVDPYEIGNNKKYKIEINQSDIVFDIKKIIAKKEVSIPINQIGLYVMKKNNKILIKENSLNLFDFIKKYEITKRVIHVYSIGKQVDTAIANLIEYSGPIVTFLVYALIFRDKPYSIVEKYSILMSCFHYLKRCLEGLYIHIHTKTMELAMLFIECIYYIGYYGIFCGYYMFNNEKAEFSYWRHLPTGILFLFCEINNFNCHIILRKIRLSDSAAVMVPEGNLFRYVYCANYFWEVGSWICMSVFTGLWQVGVFTLIGFTVMTIWALEKKKRYEAKFGVCGKKAILPFIL